MWAFIECLVICRDSHIYNESYFDDSGAMTPPTYPVAQWSMRYETLAYECCSTWWETGWHIPQKMRRESPGITQHKAKAWLTYALPQRADNGTELRWQRHLNNQLWINPVRHFEDFNLVKSWFDLSDETIIFQITIIQLIIHSLAHE